MEAAFSPPLGITIGLATLAALLAAILPTCLYLYVEPRGRLHWGVAGDNAKSRRAPALVRLSAWLSFAVGQLAFLWLLVPAWCGLLLYLQMKLGFGRTVSLGLTAGAGVAALLQAVLALRLLPLGVRLLSRDAKACARAADRGRLQSTASALFLVGAGVASWAVATIPGLVHPWVGATLQWTALRPVMAYAAVCLVHGLLLGRCASVVARK
jgi:hypothetical protein